MMIRAPQLISPRLPIGRDSYFGGVPVDILHMLSLYIPLAYDADAIIDLGDKYSVIRGRIISRPAQKIEECFSVSDEIIELFGLLRGQNCKADVFTPYWLLQLGGLRRDRSAEDLLLMETYFNDACLHSLGDYLLVWDVGFISIFDADSCIHKIVGEYDNVWIFENAAYLLNTYSGRRLLRKLTVLANGKVDVMDVATFYGSYYDRVFDFRRGELLYIQDGALVRHNGEIITMLNMTDVMFVRMLVTDELLVSAKLQNVSTDHRQLKWRMTHYMVK